MENIQKKIEYEKYDNLEQELRYITSSLDTSREKLNIASDNINMYFSLDNKGIDNGKLRKISGEISKHINNINNKVIYDIQKEKNKLK